MAAQSNGLQPIHEVTNCVTEIPNELIKDGKLRWQELGLMAYLLSKPDDYDLDIETICNRFSISEESAYKALKNLRSLGYVYLQRLPNGKTSWIVSDTQVIDFGGLTGFVRKETKRLKVKNWLSTRKRIFARDNFTCRYCGYVGQDLECDHYMPLYLGGSNEDENLVTSCKSCNRKKGSMLPSDFIAGGDL